MKSKIWLSGIVLILVIASFTLGYHSGYTRARKRAVFLAVDAGDTAQQGSVKAEYYPYFTKLNPIPSNAELRRPTNR